MAKTDMAVVSAAMLVAAQCLETAKAIGPGREHLASMVSLVCNASWKELLMLAIHINKHRKIVEGDREATKIRLFKVYNDDEPLMSPTSVAWFNPMLESENEEEQEEENTKFQGFNVNLMVFFSPELRIRGPEMCLLLEAAIVVVNRSYETYAVVLKLKAPLPPPSLTMLLSPILLIVAVLPMMKERRKESQGWNLGQGDKDQLVTLSSFI